MKKNCLDIIKIGIGPSSSHTMGPWKAALDFILQFQKHEALHQVERIQIHLYNSLAKTGKGHGTPLAIVLGLSGFEFQKEKIENPIEIYNEILSAKKIILGKTHPIPFQESDIVLNTKEKSAHPNTMVFYARMSNDSIIKETYYSLGGGYIQKATEKPQNGPDKTNEYYNPFDAPEIKNNSYKIWQLALDEIEKEEENPNVRKYYARIWDEMQNTIFTSIKKDEPLPGNLKLSRRSGKIAKNLLNLDIMESKEQFLDEIRNRTWSHSEISLWISCFSMATNEENASFGRIVTSPTNGASGVLPACLLYGELINKISIQEHLVQVFLTAAYIGNYFRINSSVSAAMGGCMAEVGVSSAMAAAALVELHGGSNQQILKAAEIAIEHHLGLTCDPVNGLVQIPCIERNAVGAVKAIHAFQLAMAEVDHQPRVSFEDVTHAFNDTATFMHNRFKETSEGGLAKSLAEKTHIC